ncbi:hypothetical protein J6590_039827 [Homalodisca vitripennis]|nr:hypothetical protein J6590_039827 [Homalodisca vitripennis]
MKDNGQTFFCLRRRQQSTTTLVEVPRQRRRIGRADKAVPTLEGVAGRQRSKERCCLQISSPECDI